MQIRISATGVKARQVHELAAASASVFAGEISVGCDGPELFRVETPSLRPHQFATIVSMLVTFNGSPLGDAIENAREAH